MKRGRVFVIAGPSGAGKGTVTGLALEKLGSRAGDFHFSVSVTTRPKRRGDVEGRDYFFVSRDEFEKFISDGGLLEYEEVFGCYYGTLKSEVEGFVESSRDVILELDVKGALNVKANMPSSLLVFIMPPSIEELRSRLQGRSRESGEEISKRLIEAPREMGEAEHFDVLIVNDEAEKAADELAKVLGGEAG